MPIESEHVGEAAEFRGAEFEFIRQAGEEFVQQRRKRGPLLLIRMAESGLPTVSPMARAIRFRENGARHYEGGWRIHPAMLANTLRIEDIRAHEATGPSR